MNQKCIENLLRSREGLSSSELLMLLLLVMHHDSDHKCEGTFDWLAELYGCKPRNAKLLVAGLKARGLLEVTKTKGAGYASNVYVVSACRASIAAIRQMDGSVTRTDGTPLIADERGCLAHPVLSFTCYDCKHDKMRFGDQARGITSLDDAAVSNALEDL